MTGNTSEWLRAAIASLAILLTACGGGGGSGAANNGGGGGGGTGGGGAASFTVGGTVSGLSGAGLILQINGGADLALTSSGNFNFAVPVVVGASYNVSIRAQPSNPTQTCALSNASGTIGNANVTNVTVTCTTNIYSVGGVVSGLSVDAGLVLQSGSEELPVSRNGSFVFATGVASGAIYNVTVRAQPTAPVQTCAVTNATGTMGAAEVSNVVVSCDGIALLAGALGGPGSIDGMGAVARFKRPADVAIDPLGNIYVSDSGNRTVRKITAAGVVSTVAGMVGQSGSDDGNGSAARFFAPAGMTADSAGNVYVADSTSHVIRRITPAGDVTTLAGAPGQSGSADGAASVARFWVPSDIVGDASGNLYVADSFNHTIRRITPAGVVSTFAGTARQFGTTNGTGSAARFNAPRGLVIDAAGNLYVTDTNNHTIRKITPGAVVTTFAGTPGQFGAADGSPALFSRPDRIGIDAAGDLLVTDTGNHTIRRITPAGVTSTFAGLARTRGSVDGVGSAARFSNPIGLAVDAAGNTYVADDSNHAIRKITPAGEVSTLAGAPLQAGSVDGSGAAARFFEPNGIAADAAGNVYVVDSSRHTVRKITPAGFVTTLAGTGDRGAADGDAATAQFSSPAGIVADSGGNLYVTDFANSTIRKITPAGIVSTVAGLAGERGSDDGIGSSARFDSPYGIAVDGSGTLYVADQVNTIRKITPEGVVSTLAGTAQLGGSDDGAGSAATFQSPQGLDVDADGNVYVADTYNHTIRKITPAGVVSTLAGSPGLFAFADGIGSAARFNTPTDVAVDSAGHVYVADQFNYTIRRIEPDGTVTTVAGARDSFGVRLGPLPGSLGEIRSIALLPDPQPRLVETDGEKGILLITLP